MQQVLMSDTEWVIACLFQCKNKKKKIATQNTPVVLETVPNYPAGAVSATQHKAFLQEEQVTQRKQRINDLVLVQLHGRVGVARARLQ